MDSEGWTGVCGSYGGRFCLHDADLLDLLFQPFIKMAVPVEVRRPFAAATVAGSQALGVIPLFFTGGALSAGVESMPGMATGTKPLVGGLRFPVAFWA